MMEGGNGVALNSDLHRSAYQVTQLRGARTHTYVYNTHMRSDDGARVQSDCVKTY